MERYLKKDENVLNLPKLGYQIKYYVIRTKVELAKELFDSSMSKIRCKARLDAKKAAEVGGDAEIARGWAAETIV